MRGSRKLCHAVALALATATTLADVVPAARVQVVALGEALSSALAGYPFAGPLGPPGWEPSASRDATTSPADDAWVALVCSGPNACPSAVGPDGRRLAEWTNLTQPQPTPDATVVAIANQAKGVFSFDATLATLPGFMTDIIDSNLLSVMGMVITPMLSAIAPSFGEVWSKISGELMSLADEIMTYVEITELKAVFAIQQNKFGDLTERVNSFWTEVMDLKIDATQRCRTPYPPETTFEQFVSRSGTYLDAVKGVCLTSPRCVDALGLEYVSRMVLAFRNAMLCTSLSTTKESRQAVATQRVSKIRAIAADFRNAMDDARRKLTANDKGATSIANATSTIASKSSDYDRITALVKENKKFEWLDMQVVSWSEDDKFSGEGVCKTKFRFEHAAEDANLGMRVEEAQRALVVWGPKGEHAFEITTINIPFNAKLRELEDKYNAYPAEEKFGFAVVPQTGLAKDMSRPRPGEPSSSVTLPECTGVVVVAVHGKKFNPPKVESGEVKFSAENQNVIDSAFGMADVSRPAGSTSIISEGAAIAYFNGITNDARAQTDLAGAFASSSLAKTLGARDPAILTGPLLGYALLDKSTNKQIGMMDSIEDHLVKTNAVEVGMIKGFTGKMDVYFSQETQGLTNLGDSMTTWHQEEMDKYDEIEGNVDKLGATISNGFSATSATISNVQASISNDLRGLKNQVVVSAEETRRVVKGVLDTTTQRTLGALDQLSGSVRAVHEQTMSQIANVNNVIVQRNEHLRGAIRQEFYENQVQTKSLVVSAASLVVTAARATTDALLNQIDAAESMLVTQLRTIAGNIDVLQGQIVLLETQFANVQKQVDKMLTFLASIQHTSNAILSAVGSYPEALRKALFQNNLDRLLLSYKKLNYAFTKYVETGLAPVYRNDLLTACTSYANTDELFRSFTNLITGTASADVLEKHIAQFEYSTKNYEQFGNQIAVAAYNTQRLSLVCARLQNNLNADEFLRLANRWDLEVDNSVARHVVNVEENVPRFFLRRYYTEPVLSKYLTEERGQWTTAPTDTTTTPPFALAAIESLRYRLQQQVDVFTAVSVINAADASQLALWTLEAKGGAMLGLNRYGASRVRNDLVVLWSNTRMELPTAFRKRLEALDLPTTLDTDSLNTAFRGTPWQPYWDAGLVRAVARVAKVDDACPWAVSRSHYPLCWERASACQCVQLEGLPATPTAEAMTNRSLVPTDVALFTTFESATDPRSEFVTTATRQTRATASDASLAATAMRGVPANRVRFSLCMTSGEAVHTAHLVTGDAHEPPPQFTRCLASDQRTYNVVPDAVVANGGGSTFVRTGASVSEAMFRTLAIGDTVPEVTFFDAQDGGGNYIVCANCVMDELRTVFMFRVLSFKIGRPSREKSVVCERHPRLPNIEYCPQTATTTTTPAFWTPPVLLATELPRLVAHIGAGWEPGLADRVTMAERVSAGLATLLGPATDDFAYFKVYVSPAGAFDNTTDAYWTSLPSHEGREERGWTVVPAFYATRAPPPPFTSDDYVPVTLAYDALVMWSTLPAEPRRVAYHVMSKKPAGVSLKQYLGATFAAYGTERILRGFFAERMAANATECPVAGDTDHFAYCTPTPVDAQCMCVQLEDLPDEYRELYDGSAPNGRVVSFQGDAANATTAVASYVIGRSHQQSARPLLVDGRPWRNLSDASLCLQTDFSHPERGATCVVAPAGSGQPRGLRVELATAATPPSVAMGDRVSEVVVSTASWSARCRGCTDAVVSEMVQFQEDGSAVDVAFAGLVAGSYCATVSSDGGGELTVCVVETR